jgi:alpha-D-xyloside xylohydrolase
VGNVNNKPDYDYANGVILHVFEIQDGANLSSIVYNIDSNEELKVNVKRNGHDIIINVDVVNKPWSILFRGVFEAQEVKNATCILEDFGIRLIPYKDSYEISLNITV